jgi:hypothetical protein
MILQELGGAEWLRKQLDKNAKMPAKYYKTTQTSESQPYQ